MAISKEDEQFFIDLNALGDSKNPTSEFVAAHKYTADLRAAQKCASHLRTDEQQKIVREHAEWKAAGLCNHKDHE